ncbi:MAG: hypothetical protein A4E34_01333 [Methanoregula sp. PtaU1.Bin006]|nr:MAG: hypothetical protein A4E34_01333 [Methanoregula sp. PtaU1.Bin006]
MVCRDVAECVAEAFVVLGDGHNGDDVAACHVHGYRVGTPDSGLDVCTVEHSNLVLVDDRVGGCCCNRGGRRIVGCRGVETGARDLNKEQLAAADLGDLGVVAIGDLDHVLDPGCECICILDTAAAHAAAEDLVVLATHLTGLECVLDTGEVDCNGPLGEVDDACGSLVDQRADLVDGNIAL